MDYRCPRCSKAIRRRKLTQAVVARMEIDCPHCRGPLQLNIHRSEMAAAMAGFAAFLVVAAAGWWLKSDRLVLLAIGVAMITLVALSVLEHLVLRTWPRYAPNNKEATPRERLP